VNKPEEQSLLGVVIRDGRLCQRVRHADGTETVQPVVEESPDPYKETVTVPAPWNPQTENALRRRRPEDGWTREEHVKRSLAVEAVWVRWTSGRTTGPGTETINTRGNAMLASLLKELGAALGYQDVKIVS